MSSEKDKFNKSQLIPCVSKRAPNWSCVGIFDSKLKEFSLNDFNGKYLLLIFYPYDFAFPCPIELIQFSDRIDEFRNFDTEVVAASTDSVYSHFAWINTPRKQGGLGEMKIPVLADKNHEISKTYGILDELLGISLRAMFLIDRDQILRHVTINEISLPRSVDEVLRLIQACQFIDNYGDSCPAGPKENINQTIKGEDYFALS